MDQTTSDDFERFMIRLMAGAAPSPQEFSQAMTRLIAMAEGGHPGSHDAAIDAVCGLLASLGYGDGASTFKLLRNLY